MCIPRRVESSDHGKATRLDGDAKSVQALARAIVAEEIERREWEKEARKSARSEDAYSELGESLVNHLGVASDDADHATLILDRDGTTVSFGDADGDTFRTSLSQVSDNVLAGGSTGTLLFATGIVDTAIAQGSYAIGVHLEGLERKSVHEGIIQHAR